MANSQCVGGYDKVYSNAGDLFIKNEFLDLNVADGESGHMQQLSEADLLPLADTKLCLDSAPLAWTDPVLEANLSLPEMDPGLMPEVGSFIQEDFQRMLNEWESHLGNLDTSDELPIDANFTDASRLAADIPADNIFDEGRLLMPNYRHILTSPSRGSRQPGSPRAHYASSSPRQISMVQSPAHHRAPALAHSPSFSPAQRLASAYPGSPYSRSSTVGPGGLGVVRGGGAVINRNWTGLDGSVLPTSRLTVGRKTLAGVVMKPHTAVADEDSFHSSDISDGSVPTSPARLMSSVPSSPARFSSSVPSSPARPPPIHAMYLSDARVAERSPVKQQWRRPDLEKKSLVVQATEMFEQFQSSDVGSGMVRSCPTSPSGGLSRILVTVQSDNTPNSGNTSSHRIIASQKIKDALPRELIEKIIKASSQRSKTIAIIEPVPSGGRPRTGVNPTSRQIGTPTRFNEAATYLSQTKLAHVGIVNPMVPLTPKSPTTSPLRVNVDHDYCSPNRPTTTRRYIRSQSINRPPPHFQMSGESVARHVIPSMPPLLSPLSCPSTALPVVSDVFETVDDKRDDGRKDSGLESGEVSDDDGLYDKLPSYLTSSKAPVDHNRVTAADESDSYNRLPTYLAGPIKQPQQSLLKSANALKQSDAEAQTNPFEEDDATKPKRRKLNLSDYLHRRHGSSGDASPDSHRSQSTSPLPPASESLVVSHPAYQSTTVQTQSFYRSITQSSSSGCPLSHPMAVIQPTPHTAAQLSSHDNVDSNASDQRKFGYFEVNQELNTKVDLCASDNNKIGSQEMNLDENKYGLSSQKSNSSDRGTKRFSNRHRKHRGRHDSESSSSGDDWRRNAVIDHQNYSRDSRSRGSNRHQSDYNRRPTSSHYRSDSRERKESRRRSPSRDDSRHRSTSRDGNRRRSESRDVSRRRRSSREYSRRSARRSRSRSPPRRSRSRDRRSRSRLSDKSSCRTQAVFTKEKQVKEQQWRRQQQEKQRQVEERRVVYVGRISEGTLKDDLRKRFEVFGPVVEISLHFRDHGDNYGFVTFQYKVDAYEAVEHGNDDPGLPKYDLCFGGRRAFCKEKYSDLDNVDDPPGEGLNQNIDFDELLKAAIAKKNVVRK